MADAEGAVAIDVATAADAPLLTNLLELYIHDLSEVFALETDDDGRFGYDRLPLYWEEPGRRFPFLIRRGARVVGFALAMRGSPASDNPDDLDLQEFFVLRRYRRMGVGREAARLLWNRLPGRWIVRVSRGNHVPLPFWSATIAEYTGGTQSEYARPGDPHPWHVFAFDTVTSSPEP
jgi:predicted acetyltransferase